MNNLRPMYGGANVNPESNVLPSYMASGNMMQPYLAMIVPIMPLTKNDHPDVGEFKEKPRELYLDEQKFFPYVKEKERPLDFNYLSASAKDNGDAMNDYLLSLPLTNVYTVGDVGSGLSAGYKKAT